MCLCGGGGCEGEGELGPQEDTDACRVQKRASELQYLTWVLGTDLGSSVDTLWNPNC